MMMMGFGVSWGWGVAVAVRAALASRLRLRRAALRAFLRDVRYAATFWAGGLSAVVDREGEGSGAAGVTRRRCVRGIRALTAASGAGLVAIAGAVARLDSGARAAGVSCWGGAAVVLSMAGEVELERPAAS